MNTLSRLLSNLRKRTPVGSIQMYAGSSEPSDWLICDGRAVLRSDYPNLFSVIGTSYGAGDGSTTFNIPDLCGKMPLGVNVSHPITGTGSSGGAETVTLTAAQTGITAHSHTYIKPPTTTGGHTLTTSEIPAHTHGEKALTGSVQVLTNNNATKSGIVTKIAGNFNGSMNSGSLSGLAAISFNATHTHVAVGGNGSHTHGITNTSATTTGNPTAANASTAHNNMPPYRTVNFIIYAGK